MNIGATDVVHLMAQCSGTYCPAGWGTERSSDMSEVTCSECLRVFVASVGAEVDAARLRLGMPGVDRLLTLRVLFRDEPAAAEITPERAAAYLTAKGWKCDARRLWARWESGPHVVSHYLAMGRSDHGAHMVQLINDLAEIEGRSPLAVWHDMMENKT